jgi:hypothetical protein
MPLKIGPPTRASSLKEFGGYLEVQVFGAHAVPTLLSTIPSSATLNFPRDETLAAYSAGSDSMEAYRAKTPP